MAGKLADKHGQPMPTEGWDLLDAIDAGRYSQATNLFFGLVARREAAGFGPLDLIRAKLEDLGNKLGITAPTGTTARTPSAVEGPAWHSLVDAHWVYALGHTWSPASLHAAVHDITNTLSPGCLFFGDTDLGRFAVDAAMENRSESDRFILLTQNQLCDGSYFDYLEARYGSALQLPDAQMRHSYYAQSTAPGFGTGMVAVAKMNGILSQAIVTENTRKRVMIEGSWYLPPWCLDRLLPRGPIFEIAPVQVPVLSPETLAENREYWSKVCERLIGNRIQAGMRLSEVCQFVEKVHVRRELAGFSGDVSYLDDAAAQEWWGMSRHSSAAVYEWRFMRAKEAAEGLPMWQESLQAYMQTLALAPRMGLDFANLLERVALTNEARQVRAVVEVASQPRRRR